VYPFHGDTELCCDYSNSDVKTTVSRGPAGIDKEKWHMCIPDDQILR